MQTVWALAALLVAVLGNEAFAGTADQDYAAWQAVQRQSPGREKADRTKEQTEQFWRDKSVELDRISEAFLAAHPDDERRWEVMLRPIQMARWRSFDDDASREHSLKRDLQRLEQIMAAPGLRADLAEQAQGTYVQRRLDDAAAQHAENHDVDLRAIAAVVDKFAAAHADSRSRSQVERRFLDLAMEIDAGFARARMDMLAKDANAAVADVARALIAKAGYLGRELEMKFTATDGREVDLAKLRGKVVLVDFWATWCGPCMNEMPHVKAAYAKYRERGFEVIGVSLDGGGITKGIQSGVRTREDFLAFLEREKMPWAQHYDNLGWKNEFAQKFGIKSIPAVFLIDREGKVIATELRGEGFDRVIGKAVEL